MNFLFDSINACWTLTWTAISHVRYLSGFIRYRVVLLDIFKTIKNIIFALLKKNNFIMYTYWKLKPRNMYTMINHHWTLTLNTLCHTSQKGILDLHRKKKPFLIEEVCRNSILHLGKEEIVVMAEVKNVTQGEKNKHNYMIDGKPIK